MRFFKKNKIYMYVGSRLYSEFKIFEKVFVPIPVYIHLIAKPLHK